MAGLFFPALLLGLQIGLISSWNVYHGNQAEFDHGLLDLLPFFLLATMVLIAAFWLLPVLLPSRAHSRTISFLTVLGLLLYLQGNLLVWDYGVFDGGEVPWADHQPKGWLELALWAGALALAMIRPGMWFRHARNICLALVGLQCGFLLVTSFGSEEGFWHREGSFADMPPAEIYQYSKNRNVVHLLLDAFQTDAFVELVDEENLHDKLDGFVIYQDNLGVAAHTSFAIPAIFSGEIFDGNESPTTYFGRCINELGFQNLLYDAGYRINLLPRLGMDKGKYSNYFRVPNTFGGSRGFRQRQAVGQLLDAGLFRQLPHFAKKWIHNSGQWRISGLISTPPAHRSIHQRAFLSDYISRIDPVLEEPTYNFMHIMSPHPPYGIKADGSPSDDPLPLTRENYKHEARYCLRVFMDLLRKLKASGVYDDALIILQGDHGNDFPPVIDGKAVELPAGRAPTLLAIKAPSAAGPLEISPVPSSIADLPATVADMLGIDNDFPGFSLLELSEGEDRTRGFFQYLSRNRENPILRRFVVQGSVFDPANWRERSMVNVVQDAADYTWGDMVEFGMEGNADPFTGQGWAAPSSNGTWTDGSRAHLKFQVQAPGEDVVFLFAMHPFLVPGKLDRQRVGILVNDANLITLDVTEPQTKLYKLTIPGELVQTNETLITLVLPDATIPEALGVGGDKRQLGVSVLSICLFPESMTEEMLRRTAAAGPPRGASRPGTR
ncbi:MAG: sulfatase-like hydrolase/transferase [Candidatus Krumholzibacteriota bacterium]